MMPAAVAKLKDCNRHGGALKLHRGCGFGEVSIAPLQPQTPTNPPISETGTAVAISYLPLGVAALLPCSTGRGGARNRASRESHALTAAQIANLRAAERHATKIGLPLHAHAHNPLGGGWSALGGHGEGDRALHRSHDQGAVTSWQRHGLALDA